MDKYSVLYKYWGYNDFRELQAEIIDSVLDGYDTLGLLPTGGGKSITFQVPAMMLPGLTIVITPLISLMKDQVDNLLSKGIRAYCLHSGLTRAESKLAMDRCRLGKVKLLYVSPERLQSQTFTDNIRDWNISLIVVDEAHCISQWGYDFRPSYLKIKTLRKLFPNINVLALTASATPEVAADITTQLEFRPGHKKYAKSFNRSNLNYIVRYDDFKERTLIKVIKGTTGTAIVYVRSRRKCRELASMLEAEGISASYYHAGLDPQDKEERQNAWKDGTARVMVATNAFGMGIDKADVRAVVHFDIPSSLEEYYQEAGRAGRDGKTSYAVIIAAKSDKMLLSKRISDTFPAKEYIAKVYEQAGNFLEVAVGSGYNEIYEFNFSLFCERFRLSPIMAYSALKILTQSNYIEFVDEVQSRSRVMIIIPKSEFYGLTLDSITDNVFSELQRCYSGLFADFVHIDENLIARRANVTAEQVYTALLTLSRMKVITYVPKKNTPYLFYSTSREEPKYLLLPKTAYEDRKKRMENRIDWMKKFVFDSTQCRVKTMLQYFGEDVDADCGTCDVCRSAKKLKPTIKQSQEIENAILRIAAQSKTCSVESILSSISASHSDIFDALRTLADNGNIKISGQTIICT